MVEWISVSDSTRVVAVAYDAENETICVRFPNDVEWCYEACPPHVWEDFMAPGVSKGKFIHDVLNHQTHHRYEQPPAS
ncbi:KTSC domain-containing protein [Georgenia thermotolerans]|uniref:KTSC domain-containing protein n=2 Tax=Georgenia thermotolerans TaxID=527326 RepID=A0A7J5UJE0_9MICO|nr:KTSC domain-containing protein [Georgenia thermotolerans]